MNVFSWAFKWIITTWVTDKYKLFKKKKNRYPNINTLLYNQNNLHFNYTDRILRYLLGFKLLSYIVMGTKLINFKLWGSKKENPYKKEKGKKD